MSLTVYDGSQHFTIKEGFSVWINAVKPFKRITNGKFLLIPSYVIKRGPIVSRCSIGKFLVLCRTYSLYMDVIRLGAGIIVKHLKELTMVLTVW